MGDAMNTNRRTVLRWAGSGIAVAFAGCNTTSSGSNQPPGRNTTTKTTDSNEATETEGTVEIVARDFKRVQTTIPPDNVVWGKLKNTGEQYITTLEVEATFRNRAGTVLGTQTASIEGFEPGGVWEPYLQSFGFPGRVATGELAVTKAATGSPPEKPDAAAVLPESLRPARESKTPTAAGEIENTGQKTIERLEAHAKFYAMNDSLLDTGSTTITGLNPDETREFDIKFEGYEELAAPRVASYDVSLNK